ncbi:MAG TPA: AraC family transcriptional regulator [Solirubrobacterales bacterium]|nr:AraC family transcriptional regulator [Solirubrobacterales bacterium]
MSNPALPDHGFRGAPVVCRRLPGFLLTDLLHRTGSRGGRHSHGGAYFSLLVAGSYREMDGGRRCDYQRGTVRFHPPAFQHADEVGAGGARFLCVEVGDEVLSALPGRWRRDPFLAGPHTSLSRLAGELHRELLLADGAGELVLEGLALQLAGTLARLPVEETVPPWLLAVAERLRAERHLPLRLADLAHEAGVHPVHVARAFRRHFQRSVGEELRRLRVEAVCDELSRPGASIADAACAAGFADQSHCTRVFRRHLGMSPAQFRERAAMARRRSRVT